MSEKLPKSFSHFVAAELIELQKKFGLGSVAEILEAEKDFFKNMAKNHPEKMLALYQEERLRNQMLTEMIWAIVKKAGGEIRLKAMDLAPIDWNLIETYDLATDEKVIKAIIKPPTNEYEYHPYKTN